MMYGDDSQAIVRRAVVMYVMEHDLYRAPFVSRGTPWTELELGAAVDQMSGDQVVDAIQQYAAIVGNLDA